MHILIVADGRSPTALSWSRRLAELGYRISLVSSFPCAPPDLGRGQPERFAVLPVAFGQFAAGQAASPGAGQPRRRSGSLVRRFRGAFLAGRYLLGPLSVLSAAPAFRRLVSEVNPDLVHALRIPYEGMLASFTPPGVKLAVSIWGNDLTLHARGSALMGDYTRRCLEHSHALAADSARDLRLARLWGFDGERPQLVAPGSGGLDIDVVRRGTGCSVDDLLGEPLAEDQPLVVNPRGIRPGSLRTDAFFRAIPGVLARFPEARFACVAMAGQPEAERMVRELGLGRGVRLLPILPQPRLWDLFRRAEVLVSPGEHDGTPNTLLEGMACGSFPVAGDIESLREWITAGVNGLLVDPGDPEALAEAVCLALESPGRRLKARTLNVELVARRAGAEHVAPRIAAWCENIMGR